MFNSQQVAIRRVTISNIHGELINTIQNMQHSKEVTVARWRD